MLLSEKEIRALTGRVRPTAQRRALERMGIAHHVRPDGRPVVTWSAVDGSRESAKDTAPNWTALAGS